MLQKRNECWGERGLKTRHESKSECEDAGKETGDKQQGLFEKTLSWVWIHLPPQRCWFPEVHSQKLICFSSQSDFQRTPNPSFQLHVTAFKERPFFIAFSEAKPVPKMFCLLPFIKIMRV